MKPDYTAIKEAQARGIKSESKTPETDAAWVEFMQSHFNAADICKLRILSEKLEKERDEAIKKLSQ